jgi:hypothetical protein
MRRSPRRRSSSRSVRWVPRALAPADRRLPGAGSFPVPDAGAVCNPTHDGIATVPHARRRGSAERRVRAGGLFVAVRRSAQDREGSGPEDAIAPTDWRVARRPPCRSSTSLPA